MRTLALWLALGCTVACSRPPTQLSSSDGTSTDASATMGPTSMGGSDATGGTGHATASSATTGDVCPDEPPDGGYEACPGLCGDGGQCFQEPGEYAVCTRGCFMDCNCWAAPGDGDAPARCSSELLETTSVCVLDCAAGQTCPSGMFCVADLGICAHPLGSSDESTEGVVTDTGTTGGSSDSGTTGGSSDSGTTGGSSDSGGSSGSGGSSDSGGSSGSEGSSDSGGSSSSEGSSDSGTTGGGSSDSGTTGGSSTG